jgi:solute carrier family 12 sodium/potassium/chloride transporter 2
MTLMVTYMTPHGFHTGDIRGDFSQTLIYRRRKGDCQDPETVADPAGMVQMEDTASTPDTAQGTTPQIRRFGVFEGVFVPTLVNILDAIMYLRLGWVVGNVGLAGAWILIIFSFIITTTTALSISSIVTNIRIGAGGAYSIISRSMGMEIGSSIGIPLFMSLALSVALWIFGFREGLTYLYPQAPPLLVDLAVFGIVFLIVLLNTRFAFRIQYVILAIIVVSLVSVFAAGFGAPDLTLHSPPGDVSVWMIFAVLFPAATGFMAGTTMSGELKDPRRSIPLGTLAAIGVSFAIYMLLSWWLAGTASSEVLIGNYTIMIDKARVGSLVLAGLLAATFSSALNSMVGASRVLHAMGEHGVLPYSSWFARRSRTGIPRNAVYITGLIALVALLLFGSLNTVAPLITLFFLITYTMVNLVILMEQGLGLDTFRPSLRISRLVPLAGTICAFFAMLVINSAFTILAIIVIASIYYLLTFRHLPVWSPYGDVRSSLFTAISEWAARKSMKLPQSRERAWHPNLLVPIDNPPELRGTADFIRDIVRPRGSITILGLTEKDETGMFTRQIASIGRDLEEDGIYSRWTIIETKHFDEGTVASVQALRSAFFSPNIIYLILPPTPDQDNYFRTVMEKSTENRIGILLYVPHLQAGLGRQKVIHLWLDLSCSSWKPGTPLTNCDLSLLIAYKLRTNWKGSLTIIVPVEDKERIVPLRKDLALLIEEARIPVDDIIVIEGDRDTVLKQLPPADLEIFSLNDTQDLEDARRLMLLTRSSCLLCRDSGDENALV